MHMRVGSGSRRGCARVHKCMQMTLINNKAAENVGDTFLVVSGVFFLVGIIHSVWIRRYMPYVTTASQTFLTYGGIGQAALILGAILTDNLFIWVPRSFALLVAAPLLSLLFRRRAPTDGNIMSPDMDRRMRKTFFIVTTTMVRDKLMHFMLQMSGYRGVTLSQQEIATMRMYATMMALAIQNDAMFMNGGTGKHCINVVLDNFRWQ